MLGVCTPGPPKAVSVTGIEAVVSPLDVTAIDPAHDPVAACGLTVTFNVAGVFPAVGVTDKKFEHVVVETATENGDAPAVLASATVCEIALPGAPPPAVLSASDGGFAVIVGDATTLIVTPTLTGLLLVPPTVIVTVPV